MDFCPDHRPSEERGVCGLLRIVDAMGRGRAMDTGVLITAEGETQMDGRRHKGSTGSSELQQL